MARLRQRVFDEGQAIFRRWSYAEFVLADQIEAVGGQQRTELFQLAAIAARQNRSHGSSQ